VTAFWLLPLAILAASIEAALRWRERRVCRFAQVTHEPMEGEEAIRRDEQNVLESVRRWMRLVSERNMLKSDEERADEAERATRNAIYWTGLAEDASARLAATDDDAALFDAEVSP
jgi:hypothetical protein